MHAAHDRRAVKTCANSTQYDGETGRAAISQNFFVGLFATTSFSKTAAQ
jgi:hypothetical protein